VLERLRHEGVDVLLKGRSTRMPQERTVALNVLASARATIGSLDKIVRVVKVLGMVNAVPDFTEQPQVINGFADLLVEIFGPERGKGARSAVGMGSLPSNIPVEAEAIFEVRD
jgi:hypothetical protein